MRSEPAPELALSGETAAKGIAVLAHGWELWNEINAVQGGDYLGWTEIMLPELHWLFPRNLAMQSLGSYDGEYARGPYLRLATMPGNDVAQVHRYLDLGAKFEICHMYHGSNGRGCRTGPALAASWPPSASG